jgi:hypothetical protein
MERMATSFVSSWKRKKREKEEKKIGQAGLFFHVLWNWKKTCSTTKHIHVQSQQMLGLGQRPSLGPAGKCLQSVFIALAPVEFWEAVRSPGGNWNCPCLPSESRDSPFKGYLWITGLHFVSFNGFLPVPSPHFPCWVTPTLTPLGSFRKPSLRAWVWSHV